jgi:hypothetical protein
VLRTLSLQKQGRSVRRASNSNGTMPPRHRHRHLQQQQRHFTRSASSLLVSVYNQHFGSIRTNGSSCDEALPLGAFPPSRGIAAFVRDAAAGDVTAAAAFKPGGPRETQGCQPPTPKQQRRHDQELLLLRRQRGGGASLRSADAVQVCNNVGCVAVDGPFECSVAAAARQIVSERW